MPVSTTAAAGGRSVSRRRLNFSVDNVSFWVVFLVVPFVLYLALVIWPFVQAAFYSLTQWNGFNDAPEFVGLRNFVQLLGDATFLQTVGNNLKLLLVVPAVVVVLALAFASMITLGGPSRGEIRGIRGASFYRIVSFFPYVIPAIVIGTIWAMVAMPDGGLLNGVLMAVGLEGFDNFAWLGRVSTAMPFSMFVIVWGFVGFYMLLFIAAIKGVPSETYEAARIDGAGRLRSTVSITVPLIRDNIQTAVIYLGIMALDAFVYMQALNANGGPENTTLVIPQYLFRMAFTKSQFGYASAIGVCLAIITLIFAGLVFGVSWLSGGRDRRSR